MNWWPDLRRAFQKKKNKSALYPCFVSHMDEVTSNTKESNRTIMKMNNVFIGMNKNTGKYPLDALETIE